MNSIHSFYVHDLVGRRSATNANVGNVFVRDRPWKLDVRVEILSLPFNWCRDEGLMSSVNC